MGCLCQYDAGIIWKQSYGRGLGSFMTCPSTMEYDTGLCYNYCDDNYVGMYSIFFYDLNNSNKIKIIKNNKNNKNKRLRPGVLVFLYTSGY